MAGLVSTKLSTTETNTIKQVKDSMYKFYVLSCVFQGDGPMGNGTRSLIYESFHKFHCGKKTYEQKQCDLSNLT